MSMDMINETVETPVAGRLAVDHKIFHAWWEDHDMWDGNASYTDLETAKAHAAEDYRNDEYGYPDDDEPGPVPVFTWTKEHGSWHLLDDGQGTNVQVSESPVWRHATPDEIVQQDAARAAAAEVESARFAGMTLAEALEIAAEPGRPCSAGLLPTGSGPIDRCVVRELHETHRTAGGRTWTDADSGVA